MFTQNDLKLTRLQKIFTISPPIILIISNIFLFGPFTIYQGNLNEFAISFISIIKYFIFPSLTGIVVLSTIGFLLPTELHKRYVSILFVIGILIWLQGNIFMWNYGVFGKGAINWTQDIWRGWIDSSVWIMFLIFAIFFYKHIFKIARPTSITMVSLQIVLIVFTSFKQPDIWKVKNSQTPEAVFKFSTKQNVIHVILDELQSDIFQEIIEKDTNYYYNVFEGFVFFKETTAPFPTTIMSIPAFLSGQIYKYDIAIQDFIDTVYKGKTIPNVLFENGYDVDLAAEQGWYEYGKHTNWFYLSVPYGVTKENYEKSNATLMLNLAVFRFSPHFIKKALFYKGLDLPMFDLKDRTNYEALRHFSHKAFLQDLINNMSVKRDKPLYKLIHLTTTHWPMVLNKNCEYAGEILPYTWENIKIQSKCSLDHFIGFLNKLKSIGIYDSSLIILQADHGYWKVPGSNSQFSLQNLDKQLDRDFLNGEDFAEKVSACSPLLAIKLPNNKDRFKISSALVDISDIPATISAILNLKEKFNGKSIFEITPNEARERIFYYYDELNLEGDKYFKQINEYSINGNLRDRSSWKFIGPHFPMEKSNLARKIIFGTNEATKYLRFGWSKNEMDPNEKGLTYNWALGKSASLFIPLPKNESVLMIANVNSFTFPEPQVVTVMVDGKNVGSWTMFNRWGWQKHSIVIEPDNERTDVSVIEFLFSQQSQTQNDTRPLAVLFESIILDNLK